MSDFDLIPGRYERRRKITIWTRRVVVVFVLVLASIVAIRIALDAWNSSYENEIAELDQERRRIRMEEEEIAGLTTERDRLSRRLLVLEGIRGDAVATEMFRVLDDSLDEHVRFERWTFRRADEIVEDEKQAEEFGYFIVLPRENPEDPERSWRRYTHMEILAEADDHTSLAAFVRRLGQKPEVAQTRILNTRSQTKRGSPSVEFEIAVTIGAEQ